MSEPVKRTAVFLLIAILAISAVSCRNKEELTPGTDTATTDTATTDTTMTSVSTTASTATETAASGTNATTTT